MKNILSKAGSFFIKEPMLTVSLIIAAVSLFITPPSKDMLTKNDFHTLAILFMLLTILEGFKKENIFSPLLKRTSRLGTMRGLTCFLVYGVFFTSMFVTNDVSLIIFVPLTIILFRAGNKEKYLLPVLTFENIAAIRGSLLMPFGSPQNLYLFNESGLNAWDFIKMMSPLFAGSAVLLFLFILFLFRKDEKETIEINQEEVAPEWKPEGRLKRIVYMTLFVLVITTIVSRTEWWPYITGFTALSLLIFDRKILIRTDYVLLLTFFCFFIFSSSIQRNPQISEFLTANVKNHEYSWSILLSQIISNVPASIVLWKFTDLEGLKALLYGLDSAGLCSVIGSLASVINLRIYVREYPGKSMKFLKTFTWISLIFFAIVVVPQLIIINY